MSDEAEVPEIKKEEVFIKKKRKNLRRRENSDDEKDDDNLSTLEEIKERQKLRQRPSGVSVLGLALGKKHLSEQDMTIKNPKTGGLVNMKTLQSGKVSNTEDAYDVSIGTQFSAETNKRDEDEEMMKYIEQELHKRKGVSDATESSADRDERDPQKYLTPEEAALLSLPEHLRHSTSHRSEEMLSTQMLNGIPEVDLGIDAKIKNIEATEEAKQKLFRSQKNNKDGPSQFVPTNMAVNFMQHNRFNVDDSAEQSKRKKENADKNKFIGPNGMKRATDDYYFDKFRKQYRRF